MTRLFSLQAIRNTIRTSSNGFTFWDNFPITWRSWSENPISPVKPAAVSVSGTSWISCTVSGCDRRLAQRETAPRTTGHAEGKAGKFHKHPAQAPTLKLDRGGKRPLFKNFTSKLNDLCATPCYRPPIEQNHFCMTVCLHNSSDKTGWNIAKDQD